MNWQIKKLGDLADVITKGTTPTSIGFKYEEEGINFIKVESIASDGKFIENKFAYISNDAHQALKRSQLKEGDILFSIAGALGRTALVNKNILPANTNQALAIIRLKSDKNILKEYILSALTSGLALQQIENLKGGTAQQNLSLGQMKSFIIPIPPLSEQKQIVETLDKAFEKIDKAIANVERNIKNAEELFQSKLSQIFSKTDGGFEKTWEDIVDIRNGKSQKEVITEDGKYPIIGSSGKPIGYAKEYLCEANSTIIGRKGTINNPILIENNYWNVDTAFGLHSKDGLHYKFLFYFCKSFDFTKLDKGSGRPSLVKSDLLKIKMPVPKITEQKGIVETLDNLNNNVKAIISVYKIELINLEELKKSILEKAFKGELTSAA